METRVSMLQSGNYAYGDIVDYLDILFYFINYEGGWNVYGWVKRGLIDDVSLLGNDIKEPGY